MRLRYNLVSEASVARPVGSVIRPLQRSIMEDVSGGFLPNSPSVTMCSIELNRSPHTAPFALLYSGHFLRLWLRCGWLVTNNKPTYLEVKDGPDSCTSGYTSRRYAPW